MKNLFAPNGLALMLKEKGFDEPSIAFYYDNKLAILGQFDSFKPNTRTNSQHNELEKEPSKFTSAPIYQQVIDWLREKHSISLTVKHYASGTFSFEIQKHNGDATGWTKQTAFMSKSSFDYYESLNNGIQEALKLI